MASVFSKVLIQPSRLIHHLRVQKAGLDMLTPFTREERSPAAIRRAISVALRLVTSGLIASTCFFITSVPFTLETGSIIMILPFGGSFTDTSVCFFK
jgi:hypothetical protein